MIAAWMLLAMVVGSLLCIGALALEQVLRAHRRPARWVWAAVIAASVGWPAALWMWANRPAPPPPVASTAPTVAVGPTHTPPLADRTRVTVQVPPDSALRSFDRPILGAWAATSVALAFFFVVLMFRTRRLRRGWRTARIAGREVLISGEWGPAVVGFMRPRVVLPRWCRGLAPETLDFVLEHEEEHLRADDLRLLLMAGLLPVLVPWQLPLWWQLARLRMAVEGDCDLRVLRRHPGRTRSYIDVLLSVGQRSAASGARSATPPPLAALLSEPYSTLKRRIRIMTMPEPRRPMLSGSLLVGAAVLFGALACAAPPPTDAGGDTDTRATSSEAEAVRDRLPGRDGNQRAYPVFTPYSVAPNLDRPDEVVAALERGYAALENAPEGRADVWYFVDEDGRVQDRRLDRSSGSAALDELAMGAAEQMRFAPALNRDRKTAVWVSLPVVFGSGDASTPADREVAPGVAPTVVSSPPFDEEVPEDASGVVTGVVLDVASERPLRFTQVHLPGTGRGGLSDAEGRFRIEGVPAGTRRVVIELIGYRPAEVQVTVGPRRPTDLEVPLQATVIDLQPIVVSGGGSAP